MNENVRKRVSVYPGQYSSNESQGSKGGVVSKQNVLFENKKNLNVLIFLKWDVEMGEVIG